MFKPFSEINIRDEDLTDELIDEYLHKAYYNPPEHYSVQIRVNPRCWAIEFFFRELEEGEEQNFYQMLDADPVKIGSSLGYYNYAEVIVDDTVHPSRLVIMREET